MIKNYKEIKKEIERLENLKKNYEVVGEIVGEWKVDKNKIADIERLIAGLKNLDAYKDGKAKEEAKEIKRTKKAKAKRYRKELVELEIRKAYLEKWLAENE